MKNGVTFCKRKTDKSSQRFNETSQDCNETYSISINLTAFDETSHNPVETSH